MIQRKMSAIFSGSNSLRLKAKMILKSEGAGGALSVLTGALMPLDFHVFMKSLLANSDLRPPDVTQIEGLRLYDGDEALALVRKLRGPRLANEFFRDEIGATRCFLILIHGRLACIIWAFPSEAPRPILKMGHGDWELAGAYTVREFRGLGLYRIVMNFALWSLAKEGHHRIWAVAASDNPGPLKTIPQVGFKEVGKIRRLALWGPRFDTSKYSEAGL